MENAHTAISLFSSSGIGDIALKKCKIKTVVANELLGDRCALFRRNFPETILVEGSIEERKLEIISETQKALEGQALDFALVTPPCQGMSKNGRGKLLAEINAGRRPKIDPRNLLILPALDILKALKPTTIIFENVSEMVNTSIPFDGGVVPIIKIIETELEEYQVEAKVIEFADFGIPQRRLRLITIATRHERLKTHFINFGSLFPEPTHSKNPDGNRKDWVTVKDIIYNTEALDGVSKLRSDDDPLHKISRLDEKKYWWVKNTPPNKSAFDNQCVNCGFDGNKTHTSKKDDKGVNKASSETPLHCKKCGSLLPRPSIEKSGKLRLMSGFTSAYKRMDWNLPASAITRNFPYVCSDNKIHPEQHRTLSIREACMLHTISETDYCFETAVGEPAKLTTIRDTLGESIPPMVLQILIEHLKNIADPAFHQNDFLEQKKLIFS